MLPPQELLNFSGKVVLVTGSGQGLGAGIALRFAQAGATVAVHYHRSAEAAQGIVTEIEKLGSQALALQGDLGQREAVEKVIDKTLQTFEKIDVLINNAGIYPVASLMEMTEGQWDEMLNANLRSVFLCTQAVARHMPHGGAIVNIASIEGLHPAAGHSHYSTSKAGVLMHTRAAAYELGKQGIRVNAVSPGLIWREGLEEAWADGVQRYMTGVPLGRLGKADDIGDACLFLASPAARWITGANLVVDGGITARPIF